MKEIKCPNCKKVFQIDESDYNKVVKQIRDEEFEKELELKEAEYKRQEKSALKLAEAKYEKELTEKLTEKNLEIVNLQNELKNKETETKNKLEKKYQEEINEKEIEITELKNKLKLQDVENDLTLKNSLSKRDQELLTLTNKMEANKTEFLLREKTLKDSYEEKLKNNFIDENDILTILAENLDKTNIFNNSCIYIDEFLGFTPQEYKVFEKLLVKVMTLKLVLKGILFLGIMMTMVRNLSLLCLK